MNIDKEKVIKIYTIYIYIKITKMKKQVALLLVFIFINWLCLWNIETIADKETTQEIEVSADISNGIEKLRNNNVWVSFCNPIDNSISSKTLSLWIQQWETKDVCLLLSNGTNNIVAIDLAIVWAKEHTKKPWSYSCNLKTENNEITKFFNEKFEDTIYIPANSEIKKETKVTFPFWKEGVNVGCIEYLIKKDQQEGWMLNFKFRKVLQMKFMVLGKDLWENWNNISATNIETFKSPEGKLHTKGNIENNWVLNEAIDIHWTISNIFWFHKEFEIKDIKVTVWQSEEFNTENIEINSFLPTYGWLFNIKLDIKYKPYFDFDVSNLDIDEEIKKWWTISINKTFFQAPRLALWWLILIIFLLILAFRKPKQKVVYVQQPQQPTPTIQ